ncbi:hypothetical protein HDU76_000074 [Blyttiomyces sp. JEL0837]|nr:hypothetical protein HDU76_000074 [Blyttiomyces sp. JEL0837]
MTKTHNPTPPSAPHPITCFIRHRQFTHPNPKPKPLPSATRITRFLVESDTSSDPTPEPRRQHHNIHIKHHPSRRVKVATTDGLLRCRNRHGKEDIPDDEVDYSMLYSLKVTGNNKVDPGLLGIKSTKPTHGSTRDNKSTIYDQYCSSEKAHDASDGLLHFACGANDKGLRFLITRRRWESDGRRNVYSGSRKSARLDTSNPDHDPVPILNKETQNGRWIQVGFIQGRRGSAESNPKFLLFDDGRREDRCLAGEGFLLPNSRPTTHLQHPTSFNPTSHTKTTYTTDLEHLLSESRTRLRHLEHLHRRPGPWFNGLPKTTYTGDDPESTIPTSTAQTSTPYKSYTEQQIQTGDYIYENQNARSRRRINHESSESVWESWSHCCTLDSINSDWDGRIDSVPDFCWEDSEVKDGLYWWEQNDDDDTVIDVEFGNDPNGSVSNEHDDMERYRNRVPKVVEVAVPNFVLLEGEEFEDLVRLLDGVDEVGFGWGRIQQLERRRRNVVDEGNTGSLASGSSTCSASDNEGHESTEERENRGFDSLEYVWLDRGDEDERDTPRRALIRQPIVAPRLRGYMEQVVKQRVKISYPPIAPSCSVRAAGTWGGSDFLC